jgi:hypothetical protein
MDCWRRAGLVLAVMFVLGAFAVAQDRDNRDYNDDRDHSNGPHRAYPNGGYGNNDPAYQYGYKDGFDLGANAARTGAAYNDHGGGAYKHANNGFPGGNKGAYQQRYRQAYMQGYRAGYEQLRRAGSSARHGDDDRGDRGNNRPDGQYGANPYGGYANDEPAYQYGYKDGFDLGANAARTGAAYNDHGSGAYNHADDGFPGGDKGAYQQRYRQAYMQGYRAGYEQARGVTISDKRCG